ncbi:MAG: tetratricopeptide repeat protein, partial [Gammaproteobacteria bacterium]|nr:tetratricopeptide repeat protein [Gammaproteobacteria bacterium]NIW47500.1 tetratricopeptide repeat protein [Gammaproteobacteria bacterium]
QGDLIAFCNEYLQKSESVEAQMNLYWLLALYHDRRGEYSRACDYISKILEQKPDAFNARQRLARLNRDLRDYSSA